MKIYIFSDKDRFNYHEEEENKSCVFVGDDNYNYGSEWGSIEEAIIDMIEDKNVGFFYCLYNTDFDVTCCEVLVKLKEIYPFITRIMVFTSLPMYVNPLYFDYAMYFAEPKKYFWTSRLSDPVEEATKMAIERSDYVLSGESGFCEKVSYLVEYATRLGKTVIHI